MTYESLFTSLDALVSKIGPLDATAAAAAQSRQDTLAKPPGSLGRLEALAACSETLAADLIVVSNEVGMGLVPPYPLGRAFRDVVGRANQDLARQADEVYLLVAGLPMTLKGP